MDEIEALRAENERLRKLVRGRPWTEDEITSILTAVRGGASYSEVARQWNEKFSANIRNICLRAGVKSVRRLPGFGAKAKRNAELCRARASGMPFAEIAKRFGISVGRARQINDRYARAYVHELPPDR